jgi:YggT family protein
MRASRALASALAPARPLSRAPRPASPRQAPPLRLPRRPDAISLSALPDAAVVAVLAPATAATAAALLSPALSLLELLFVVRIVLTWYPAVDGDKLPWAVVIKPTEPLLAPTRRVVPPLAGVDVSPVVWVAILSLLNEVLAGPQGVLILMSRAAP